MRYRTLPTVLGAAAAVAAAVLSVMALGGNAATRPRWVTTPVPSRTPGTEAPASPGSSGPPAPVSGAPTSGAPCDVGAVWGCDQQRRFAAAREYLERRPGDLAVIIGDLGTGATWSAGTTASATWTASTIKLAIATAALEWHRAGLIALDDADRANLHDSLVNSSNEATTALWSRYGGQRMFDRFRTAYGMRSLSVVPGHTLFWRNLRCTAEDLYHLMSYVLSKAPPGDRGHLVGELRAVAGNQHWGVWAAGSALRPGNKDGWARKPDAGGARWVTHTVGFAGPGERYVIVVTYRQPPSGTLSDGVHTVSDLVATVFGAPVPAEVTVP